MVNIDKIYLLAKERGIKLSFICEKLGLNRTYFSDVKNKKTTISEDRINIIADILNTTPSYLNDKSEQKEKPIFNKEDRQSVELYDAIKNFSQEDIDRVLEYVRFLSSRKDN